MRHLDATSVTTRRRSAWVSVTRPRSARSGATSVTTSPRRAIPFANRTRSTPSATGTSSSALGSHSDETITTIYDLRASPASGSGLRRRNHRRRRRHCCPPSHTAKRLGRCHSLRGLHAAEALDGGNGKGTRERPAAADRPAAAGSANERPEYVCPVTRRTALELVEAASADTVGQGRFRLAGGAGGVQP